MRTTALLVLVVVAAWQNPVIAENPAVDASTRMFEVASPPSKAQGVPTAADVCMRLHHMRPLNDQDPQPALDIIRSFHVTWLEWTYVGKLSPDFIRALKEMGVTFGGAAAAGSYIGEAPAETWNVVDLDGKRLIPPWMRQWNNPNPWGCANNPEYRAGHLRAVIDTVEAGAQLLQRDEPAQNELAMKWGGCFCDYCITGFREWLGRRADPQVLQDLGASDLGSFDYRAYLRKKKAPVGPGFYRWEGDALKQYFVKFQVESTIAFHRWWREELNKHVGRYVPVSCNNGAVRWGPIERVFDYCIGELNAQHARPQHIYEVVRNAKSTGKAQTFTMPLQRGGEQETPGWVRLIRQAIATTYAVGGHIEMPYDTYLPTPDAQRYFGKPENYADLTAFVRGVAAYLDGYTDAFAAGPGISDKRWPDSLRPLAADAKEVCLFARARRGQADAPVVVHIVDWKGIPEPFELTLRSQAFFGDRSVRVRLVTPVRPYDKDAHDQAYRSGDYSGLVHETELARGAVDRVNVPALKPWGILIVEPD